MAKRRVTVIGVPLDLGAGHRGVDMGPSAFRVAESTHGAPSSATRSRTSATSSVQVAETRDPGDPRLKYLKEIRATA